MAKKVSTDVKRKSVAPKSSVKTAAKGKKSSKKVSPKGLTSGNESVYRPLILAQPWLTKTPRIAAFAPPEAETRAQGISLRVGDRPIARSIRKLYDLRGLQLPPEIAALPGDTYLITHAIGAIAQEGANTIDILGYTATFEELGSTIELFPNTRFKEYLSVDLKFSSGISADGYAKLPQQVGQLLTTLAPINLGAGAELKLAASATMVGSVGFSVKTPKIQTIGNGASSASWQFNKDKDPLVGDQIMLQTVVVPKGQKKLTYTLQAYMLIDPSWFQRPVRYETKPFKVVVDLTSDPA